MFSWPHRHKPTTHFIAHLIIVCPCCGHKHTQCKQRIPMQNFTMNVGQVGTMVVTAVAADGTTIKPLNSTLAASSDPVLITIAPDPTTLGNFTVTALVAGSSNVTVAETNENGQQVTTQFAFTASAVTDPNPTTSFTATLTNVH
jgi:hypothetical protein